MEKLRANHSSNTFEKALRFLAIRLRSRTETEVYVEEIDDARTELSKKYEAYKQARAKRVAATAEVRFLDKVLSRNIVTLSLEARAITRGRRADPRFKKLFPRTPTKHVTPVATPKKREFVRNLLSRLKDDRELTTLRHHAEILDKSLASLEAALNDREAARQVEQEIKADRDQAKKNAARVYNRMSPRLQLLFEDEPALVESYFANLRRRDVDG